MIISERHSDDDAGLPATAILLLGTIPIIVLVFLAFDFVFLMINIVWALLELAGLAGERWYLIKIHSDYGLPEISNFIKYVTVAGLLFWGVGSLARRVWAPIAYIFVLLLLDDVARIHENVSFWIGEMILQDLTGPGKPAETVGQLPYYAIIGSVIFGLVWLSFKRADPMERPLVKRFFLLLVLLAFFAAGVDFVNSYFIESFGIAWMGSIGSMIENGSELIITSLCVWCAVLVMKLYQASV